MTRDCNRGWLGGIGYLRDNVERTVVLSFNSGLLYRGSPFCQPCRVESTRANNPIVEVHRRCKSSLPWEKPRLFPAFLLDFRLPEQPEAVLCVFSALLIRGGNDPLGLNTPSLRSDLRGINSGRRPIIQSRYRYRNTVLRGSRYRVICNTVRIDSVIPSSLSCKFRRWARRIR